MLIIILSSQNVNAEIARKLVADKFSCSKIGNYLDKRLKVSWFNGQVWIL